MSVTVMVSFSGSDVAVGLGVDEVVAVGEEVELGVGDASGVCVGEVEGVGDGSVSDAGAKRLSANAPPEMMIIAINATLTYFKICLFLLVDIFSPLYHTVDMVE
jgi:hypothetical protein